MPIYEAISNIPYQYFDTFDKTSYCFRRCYKLVYSEVRSSKLFFHSWKEEKVGKLA